MRCILYGAGSAAIALLLVAGLFPRMRPDEPGVAPERPAAGERLPATITDPVSSHGLGELEGAPAAGTPGDELVSALQAEIARLEAEIDALRAELRSERDRGVDLELEIQHRGIKAREDLAAAVGEGEPRAPPPVRPGASDEDSGESRLAYLERIDTALWSADDARVHADVLDALSRARQIEAQLGEEGAAADRVSLRRELGEVRRRLVALLEQERKALMVHELGSLGLEGDRANEASERIEEIIRSTESSPTRSDRRRAWAELGRSQAER